jgi:hypothetical protein
MRALAGKGVPVVRGEGKGETVLRNCIDGLVRLVNQLSACGDRNVGPARGDRAERGNGGDDACVRSGS